MVNRKDLTTASVALHWGHDYFDCGYACSSERFSRGSSWPRDWTRIPCIAGKFFSIEPPGKPAHASKVMHKILHARLQHYVNQELSDVQVGFRKGRGTRDQIHNIQCVIGTKQGNYRETSTSASLTTLKHLTVWIMTNCGKLLEVWEYTTILPVSWETRMWVKKQQLEPCIEQLVQDGFKIEKGVRQGSLLSLFCSV